MTSVRELFKGNVFFLTLGTVIRQLTLFVTFPYFSLYIRELGGSNVVIGLVNAVRPFAAMFMYPIAGSLADNYGRVKILVGTGYVWAALYTMYMLAPDWKILAFANFLGGLLIFSFPASSALLVDSMPPELRGRGYALIMAVPGVVGIFSPLIGGYLITVYGVTNAIRLLYGATGVATALIATMNWKFLKETMVHNGPRRGLRSIIWGSYGQVMETLRWMPQNLRWYALVLMLSLFFNSIAGAYWVVYAKDVIMLSELQWGTILLVVSVVQVLLSYPAGVLLDKFDKSKLITAALAISVLPILAFPYSSDFLGTLLVSVPLAISNAFLMPGAGALMADMVPPERRGRTMATLGRGMLFISNRGGGGGGPGMGFLLTFPSVLGLLVGGFIYDTRPFIPWFLLGGAFLVNALIMAFFIKAEGD